MIYRPKKSKNWWMKFTWNGEIRRESTKQPNKRVGEQILAARKTALAKAKVGLRTPGRADAGGVRDVRVPAVR